MIIIRFCLIIIIVITVSNCSFVKNYISNIVPFYSKDIIYPNIPKINKNMQIEYVQIGNNSIKQAQKIAIDKATVRLRSSIIKNIDSIYNKIYMNYNITYQKDNNIQKLIDNEINKIIKLENTIIDPEGKLYVYISTDYLYLRNIIKTSIISDLKNYSHIWQNNNNSEFNNYIDTVIINEINL